MFSNSKNIISIDLKGMIASGGRAPLNMDNLYGLFGKISKMKFDALSIVINSPGGSPVQSSLIGQKIREITKKKNVKCYCFVEDVAASGGYWLACSADEIYADINSIIGSIGVISGGFGFTELIKKIGVERRVHTAGKNKSTLDPFLEEKKEDIQRLKDIQLDLHKNFIDVVEESRGSKLAKKEVELFSGEFWSGNRSKQLGLIDDIGDANKVLKEKFGEDIVIKKFEKSKSWLSKKLSSSNDQLDQFANILDEKSIWQRYGL